MGLPPWRELSLEKVPHSEKHVRKTPATPLCINEEISMAPPVRAPLTKKNEKNKRSMQHTTWRKHRIADETSRNNTRKQGAQHHFLRRAQWVLITSLPPWRELSLEKVPPSEKHVRKPPAT